MAKKRTGKNPAASNLIDDENRLPQNIVTMGNKVEENKNIYISQPAYKAIHRFAEAKTENESGGMLIGSVIEEFGKTNIVIAGFIEAKYCKATPTTLKFTHETWDYCHKEIAKKFPGKKIVGWIHTHPNFGIFLSEYDKFIQENFFKEEYEIAFVVDPIQGIEGFYFWINEKIERCRGFYIFDKTGTRINIESVVEKAEKNAEKKSSFALNNVIIAALLAIVVFLVISVISLNGKVATLQKQQETIVSSANQSLTYMQQQIYDLRTKINELLPNSTEDTKGQEDNANDDSDALGEASEPTSAPEEGSKP